MNIYAQKRRWKWLLIAAALLIVSVSLFYTNRLVKKIAADERRKVHLWADAINRKASLIKYTEGFFEKLKKEERKRVELWAEANKRLMNAGYNEDLTFYVQIISNNTSIPVIVTDENDHISSTINVDFNTDSVKILSGELKKEFTVQKPIVVNYYRDLKIYLYYKDSKLFTELRSVLNDIIKSFLSEVVLNSASVPVIITDSTRINIIASGNLDTLKINDKTYIHNMLADMESQNKPIEIELAGQGRNYIYYKDSYLLTQLRYYPYVQFVVIGIFLFIAYLLFNTARKSEQNQVWTGMAKETAHQLGTPISSLMAWIEILKAQHVDDSIISEIDKDIKRLEAITERFSKIGSTPRLQNEDIVKVLYDVVQYLKSRTSKNICYVIHCSEEKQIFIPVNIPLFKWVIENLCKNAIDAMEGKGNIEIYIIDEGKHLFIDMSDTGKGISKRNFKTVFSPGYTSKKTGWGLGLSLCKRIIENYHKGSIFVKQSVINSGTVFRIRLNR